MAALDQLAILHLVIQRIDPIKQLLPVGCDHLILVLPMHIRLLTGDARMQIRHMQRLAGITHIMGHRTARHQILIHLPGLQ